MSICWYCHWGWPKQAQEVYARGVESAEESSMLYGPAHIVWADENFDSASVLWCIEHAGEYPGDLKPEQIDIVLRSLKELLEVPEEIRCCEPDDYDGEKPELYPPPEGIVMIPKG